MGFYFGFVMGCLRFLFVWLRGKLIVFYFSLFICVEGRLFLFLFVWKAGWFCLLVSVGLCVLLVGCFCLLLLLCQKFVYFSWFVCLFFLVIAFTTDHPSFHPAVFLFVPLGWCLFVSLGLSIFFSRSLSVCFSLPVFVSFSGPVCVSVSLDLCLSVSLDLCIMHIG